MGQVLLIVNSEAVSFGVKLVVVVLTVMLLIRSLILKMFYFIVNTEFVSYYLLCCLGFGIGVSVYDTLIIICVLLDKFILLAAYTGMLQGY